MDQQAEVTHTTHDFAWAVRQLAIYKAVSRVEWDMEGPHVCGAVQRVGLDLVYVVNYYDGDCIAETTSEPWNPKYYDLAATDWIAVELVPTPLCPHYKGE